MFEFGYCPVTVAANMQIYQINPPLVDVFADQIATFGKWYRELTLEELCPFVFEFQ